jgi:hypothetical protein
MAPRPPAEEMGPTPGGRAQSKPGRRDRKGARPRRRLRAILSGAATSSAGSAAPTDTSSVTPSTGAAPGCTARTGARTSPRHRARPGSPAGPGPSGCEFGSSRGFRARAASTPVHAQSPRLCLSPSLVPAGRSRGTRRSRTPPAARYAAMS